MCTVCINKHRTRTYIMLTKTFILDAFDSCFYTSNKFKFRNENCKPRPQIFSFKMTFHSEMCPNTEVKAITTSGSQGLQGGNAWYLAPLCPISHWAGFFTNIWSFLTMYPP